MILWWNKKELTEQKPKFYFKYFYNLLYATELWRKTSQGLLFFSIRLSAFTGVELL